MGKCGCGDLTAPGVFGNDGHAVVNQVIAHTARFAETSKVGDFQATHLGPAVGHDLLSRGNSGDAFVQLHRLLCHAAHLLAFLIGAAGLFEDVIQILRRAGHANGIVDAPSLIGICHCLFTRAQQSDT